MSSAAQMFISKRSKYATLRKNMNPHGRTHQAGFERRPKAKRGRK